MKFRDTIRDDFSQILWRHHAYLMNRGAYATSREIIRSKVSEMLAGLWKGRGGFVAKVYGETDAIGLEPIWEEYAADEFIKRGVRQETCI